MDYIDKLSQKYPSIEGYVFAPSLCSYWIIVLKKLEKNGHILKDKINYDIIDIINEFLPQTITNEFRSGIKDPNHARFIANKLLVVDIVHKFNDSKINEINNKFNIPCKKHEIINDNDFTSECEITDFDGFNSYYKNPSNAFYYKIPDNYSGQYKSWYTNGQLKIQYTLKYSKLNGNSKKWYENGNLKEECTYKNGEYDELYRMWYYNGILDIECIYKNGKKNGPHKEWYENEQLREEYTYKDGEYDGLYKEWHKNGKIRTTCTYKNGKRDGLYKSWYDNGYQEIIWTYNMEKLNGPYKQWYNNGRQEIECTYKNGKPDGPCKEWWENGQLGTDCIYKDGNQMD
jgi:antitoxin component YwqK of YwqJK toxin-antitoxin module